MKKQKNKKTEEKELYDFEAQFVSLVPKGANMKSFFLLKSDDGGIMQINQEFLQEMEEVLKSDLPAEVNEVIEKAEISDKAKTAIKGALRLLGAFQKEIGEDILKNLSTIAGIGHAPVTKESLYPYGYKQGEMEVKPEDYENLKNSLIEANEESKKEMIEKFFVDLMAAKQEPEQEDLIEKSEKYQSIIKEREELKVKLQEVENEKIEKALQEKVSGYSNLNANSEKLVSLFKGLDETKTKDLEEILKAADEQVKAGNITRETGTGKGDEGQGTAWERITKKAELICKEKNITNEAAIAHVIRIYPELYAEYETERSK